jgi:branched-chain amino acid transport system ATP-binding protein
MGPFFRKAALLSVLLETQGLVKSFGAVHAVDDVSLSLNAGDALGIIGPNGAGKSSLFNLIAGVMTVDQGQLRSAAERALGGPIKSPNRSTA